MVSILDSVKQMLGIESDATHFDKELILHINTALSVMTQLGVGPDEGYLITSKINKWSDLIGNRRDTEMIKGAVFLRVSLLFDPPPNSFLVNAIKDQIAEYDWRIEVGPSTQ